MNVDLSIWSRDSSLFCEGYWKRPEIGQISPSHDDDVQKQYHTTNGLWLKKFLKKIFLQNKSCPLGIVNWGFATQKEVLVLSEQMTVSQSQKERKRGFLNHSKIRQDLVPKRITVSAVLGNSLQVQKKPTKVMTPIWTFLHTFSLSLSFACILFFGLNRFFSPLQTEFVQR